jgi:hypothetical protein
MKEGLGGGGLMSRWGLGSFIISLVLCVCVYIRRFDECQGKAGD